LQVAPDRAFDPARHRPGIPAPHGFETTCTICPP
jgi:hypothetical protein